MASSRNPDPRTYLDSGTPEPPGTPLRVEEPPSRSSSPDQLGSNTDMETPENIATTNTKKSNRPATTAPRPRYFATVDGSSPDPIGDLDWEPPILQPGLNRSKHNGPSNSTIPQKRSTGARNLTPEPVRPPPTLNEFTFATHRPSALTPIATSAEEAIAIARNMVIQASSLVTCTKKQSQLLDLLEVFRDFTENGRVNKHGLSVLASQVSSLESVSRTIGSKVRELNKPATATTATPSNRPPPTASASTSYAAAAARGQPSTSDWQQVSKKKTTAPPPKNTLSNRQLVLIQEHPAPYNSLALRNAFNQAFANKGVTSPVMASVHRAPTFRSWQKVEIHRFFDRFHLKYLFLISPRRYFYAAALWAGPQTALLHLEVLLNFWWSVRP